MKVSVWPLFFRMSSSNVAGRSRFLARRKNNKSGAKRGARADSRQGPRTKVNAMSKEDIFKKTWPDTLTNIMTYP